MVQAVGEGSKKLQRKAAIVKKRQHNKKSHEDQRPPSPKSQILLKASHGSDSGKFSPKKRKCSSKYGTPSESIEILYQKVCSQSVRMRKMLIEYFKGYSTKRKRPLHALWHYQCKLLF